MDFIISYGFYYKPYSFPCYSIFSFLEFPLFEEPIVVLAESYCNCITCEVCLLFTVIQYQLPSSGGYCYQAVASGIGFRSVLDG